jgi:hypothetical protein
MLVSIPLYQRIAFHTTFFSLKGVGLPIAMLDCLAVV